MDGKTSLVARAANMAAAKGILVVNAAGNEGGDDWKFIGTPADADSVLSVGGVSPETNIHIPYSSFGPTSDKRMKPNVCAFRLWAFNWETLKSSRNTDAQKLAAAPLRRPCV